LNGGLHAVSIGKRSERMSNFWTVRFLKTESEHNLGFPHIPNRNNVSPMFTIMKSITEIQLYKIQNEI